MTLGERDFAFIDGLLSGAERDREKGEKAMRALQAVTGAGEAEMAEHRLRALAIALEGPVSFADAVWQLVHEASERGNE